MLLLDGFLGGLLGAVIIGAAQIWSFQPGRKDARASQSVNAARELLAVVYQSIQVLKLLPHTDSAPGSPLSYGERLGRAQPMHDALAQALFVRVPLISDKELARRFREFARLCEHVAGPEVNAEDIYKVVATAEAYGDYVRASLAAHIDSQPLPTEQHPTSQSSTRARPIVSFLADSVGWQSGAAATAAPHPLKGLPHRSRSSGDASACLACGKARAATTAHQSPAGRNPAAVLRS